MFEAYSVAVKVSLINGVTSGLMNISRGFAKAHGQAVSFQRTLDQIKFQMLAGAALAGTGLFGFHLLGKTMPAAKEYARQLALMNTLGMKQAEIARTVGDAWKATYAVPTTTAAENLKTFRELRSAFGSDTAGQAHASMMLPVVGRLAGVMQSLTGKRQEHVGFDMVKAIELRTGVMTEEALKRNSELMSKAIIGMGGTITAQDFHATLKQGKLATNKWSDAFAYLYLPTLMQEVKTSGGGGQAGAQTAGTALMTLYQAVHGKMAKNAMPLWVQGGLIKSSDVVKTSTGSFQMRPGSVAGTELFEQNPFLWVQQFLRPAVARVRGRNPGMTDETAINAMFSNRNAGFAAYNMFFKAAQYERDRLTISKADGGYAAYNKLLKTDPTLASQALHSQWQNILAQIGFSIMPTLVSGTLKLMSVLRTMAQWMHTHQGTVRVLTIAFVALSAALVFGGTVMLLSAAFSGIGLALRVVGPGIGLLFRGLFVLGPVIFRAAFAIIRFLGPIGLAVTAVVALGVAIIEMVKHWDTSKSILWNIRNELGMFFNWMLNKARGLVGMAPIPFTPEGKNPGQHGATGSWGDSSGSPHIATGRGHATHVHVPVHIDGKKVAEATAKVFNKDFGYGGAQGRYDPTAALPAAGLGYNR